MYEIYQVREGTMEMPMFRHRFDWQLTATVTAAGFVVTNLLGLALAAILIILSKGCPTHFDRYLNQQEQAPAACLRLKKAPTARAAEVAIKVC
jgi:hypothetical protein